MRLRIALFIVTFAVAMTVFAEERATATGKVVDAAGRPLEDATVMVYSAGVKKGYSIFCPTCYRDCGKRSVTGPDGNYSIGSLDPELSFTLVAVKEGYLAEFVWNVDPANEAAPSVILKPQPVEDVSRIVRGRVVDTQGRPLRDAVVQPDLATYRGQDGQISWSTPIEWINQVTVTNDRGEFEVAFSKPAMEMTLRVTARGMAPKHFTAPTGGERKTMVVTDGALIRGRLIYNGKPVAGAEVGLTPHDTTVGRWYPEARIGTRQDGTFEITNVPPGRIWLLYPKMESLATRGIGADVMVCETKSDGQEVNVGDVRLEPAYTLRGKVVLSDAKPIPPNMRVTLGNERGLDSQVAPIDANGRFEFHGLPPGIYNITPSLRGYRLPGAPWLSVEARVTGDVNDFAIRMEPESDAVGAQAKGR